VISGTTSGSDAELFGEVLDDDGGMGQGRLQVIGVRLQDGLAGLEKFQRFEGRR
jgi:hypothetical protein